MTDEMLVLWLAFWFSFIFVATWRIKILMCTRGMRRDVRELILVVHTHIHNDRLSHVYAVNLQIDESEI